MEILLAGALVTILLEISKSIMKRIHNVKLTKAVILVGGLGVSLVVALIIKHTPADQMQALAQVWVSAVGIYEVAYKLVVQPLLDKLTGVK